MSKLRVGVIFGGRSGEHEVSIASAASIFKHLDRTLYELRREDLEAVAIVCPSIQVVLEAAHQKRGDELDAVRT